MTVINEAFVLANDLHKDHFRKSTSIPYLSHLLGVASLVIEDGQDEAVVAAALLHDAAEDQGGWPTVERIREELGDEVAELVVECSDSVEEDPAHKAPWRHRKQAAIDAVPSHSLGSLHIIAADKLHNMRSMLTDLELEGDRLWQRFNAGNLDILWYHENMAAAMQDRIPQSRSLHLLHQANAELRGAIESASAI